MSRKFDSAMHEQLIIRRAMLNTTDRFKVFFSEFSATWHDAKTKNDVHFTGKIDSQISLRTAQVQGSDDVYDLKHVFTDAELRRFNYLINSEHVGRARRAA